jgi:hypothetical protein
MGDWQPDTVVRVRVNQGTGWATVYAWTIPAPVAGRWTLTTPEGRRVSLQLRQRFHRFTGPGVSGRLVGERIDFTLTERVTAAGDSPLLRPRHRRRDEREGRRWGSVEAAKAPPGAPR